MKINIIKEIQKRRCQRKVIKHYKKLIQERTERNEQCRQIEEETEKCVISDLERHNLK